MSINLTPPEVLDPIFGTLIEFTDWIQLLNYTLQTTGYCTAFQQGTTNAQTLLQPLAISPSGMVLTIGDNSLAQFVLCNGILCGTDGASGFTVPNNSSGITRTDKIWIKNDLLTITTVTREVEDTEGNKSDQSIPVVIAGLDVVYDTGGLSPPGGTYQDFAHISVANGAVSIAPGDITIQFALMNPAGPTGPAGHGSTLSTGTCTIPAVSSPTTVAVADPTAFPAGAFGFITDGTHAFVFQVTGVAGSTLTVVNLLTVAGAPTNVVGSGAVVTFSGEPGAAGAAGTPGTPGAAGSNGHGATSTTSNESIPATGAAGVLAVADGFAFPNGALGIVSDGTHAYAFEVTSGGGTSTLTTVCLAIILGAAADTISSGATVTFSGINPASAIPIGGSLRVSGGVGGSSATASLTLTPGTWNLDLVWTMEPGAGVFFSATVALTAGSGASNVSSNGAGNAQNNIDGGFAAHYTADIPGGQVVTVTLTKASGTLGNNAYSFSAVRTA